METVFKCVQKAALIIFFGALPFLLNAQKADESDGYQTLFGNNVSYGGYGALTLGYTQLGNFDAFSPGIKGAWLIGHSIGIGIEGTGFISELTTGIIENEEYSFITGGYGGLMIEPILFGMKPIHVTLPLVIGAGAIVFESSENYSPTYPNNQYHTDYDQFFIIKPGIEVEMNVTRFFRLAVGASYRFTNEVNLTTNINGSDMVVLEKNDLNGLLVGLSFKFGKF